MRATAWTLAVMLLSAMAPAVAQDGALTLTRPVGKPIEVPPSPTRFEGGALSLVAPAAPAEQSQPAPARTTMVDTSRTQRAPVAAGLTADAAGGQYPLPPAVAPAYGTDMADALSGFGGGRPGELSIRPGKTELVQVSRTHLNRFVTPFANPEVQSSAQATTTKVEGSVVYVATASPDPVGLFIVDGDNPSHAFSVTLMPREIPAVSMTLSLEGYAPGSPARAGESAAVENDFVAQLRETFRSIAQGEVPAGYGMRRVAGFDPNMPECVMPGMRATPAQEISGNQVIVIVSKLTNYTNLPQTIDESSCASDRVLAVAVWPRVDLLPGQSTELYIAVRRAPPPAANARPSVL